MLGMRRLSTPDLEIERIDAARLDTNQHLARSGLRSSQYLADEWRIDSIGNDGIHWSFRSHDLPACFVNSRLPSASVARDNGRRSPTEASESL